MSWETEYPEVEIESALESYGGWLGWIGQDLEPDYPLLALKWLSSHGADLPEEFQELAAVFASFGRSPIEDEVDRRRGLEKAFRDVGDIVAGTGKHARKLVRINDILALTPSITPEAAEGKVEELLFTQEDVTIIRALARSHHIMGDEFARGAPRTGDLPEKHHEMGDKFTSIADRMARALAITPDAAEGKVECDHSFGIHKKPDGTIFRRCLFCKTTREIADLFPPPTTAPSQPEAVDE